MIVEGCEGPLWFLYLAGYPEASTVMWGVTSDLQPPQRGAGRVLNLIKQLVLSKGEDGNQLSSAHRQTQSVR